MKKLLIKFLPFALACCLFAASAGINASADNTPTRANDIEDVVISGVKIRDTAVIENASDNGNS